MSRRRTKFNAALRSAIKAYEKARSRVKFVEAELRRMPGLDLPKDQRDWTGIQCEQHQAVADFENGPLGDAYSAVADAYLRIRSLVRKRGGIGVIYKSRFYVTLDEEEAGCGHICRYRARQIINLDVAA